MSAARLYTPELLGLAVELARHPPLAQASARGEARSPTCGSTIAMDLGLDPAGRIEQLGLSVHACAVGQAAAVAHVAAHDLGAAAYAIKAVRAAAPADTAEAAGRAECRWQRDQLPAAVRELVLDDQRRRNDICWSVFDC